MKTSILLQTHAADGARLTTGPAGETPLTFGSVPDEYRAATTGTVVFDQTDRGLVRVSGKDATDFLHRITANRIKGLEPGGGNANLLLTGKGKIVEVFDLLFLGEQEGYLLSTPPGRAIGLAAALEMYLFSEDVSLENQTESYAPLALIGPTAVKVTEGALEGLGYVNVKGRLEQLAGHAAINLAHEDPNRTGTLSVIAIETAGRAGFRLLPMTLGSDSNASETLGTLALKLWRTLIQAGASPGGLALFDILRSEACVAAFGVDIDDTVYPQEVRLEHALSLDKGCYIGQEVVAKIDTYGGLNKRLFALQTGPDAIQRGTRLWREDPERGWRDLGVVTSWAWSFALDTGLALGFVKRRHQEPGTEFRLAQTGADPSVIREAPIARLVETPLAPAADPA